MLAARPGFPFRIFLPLTQLLLCLALLWPHLPSLRNQLSLAIRRFSARVLGTEPPPDSATIVLDVTPISPRPEDALDFEALRLTAPAALNIPVGFIQIPLMLSNSSMSEWAPRGMSIREWRAVSWPFVGMIFWWMAGRAMEALSAGWRFFRSRRKSEMPSLGLIHPPLRWIELLIAVSLVVVGGATCYLLASGRGPLGLAVDYVLAAGGGLWAAMGLIIVAAGIEQWRVRRVARQEGLAAAQAV